jgi:hypothetical protein
MKILGPTHRRVTDGCELAKNELRKMPVLLTKDAELRIQYRVACYEIFGGQSGLEQNFF